MGSNRITTISLSAMLVLFVGSITSADPYMRGPEERLWEPVRDEVYLQEIGLQIPTERPALAAAVYENVAYVSLGDGVYEVVEDRLRLIPGSPTNIHRMLVLNGALWGLSENGLYRYRGGILETISDAAFVDACVVRGVVHVATRNDVYQFLNGELINIEPEVGYRSTNITVHDEGGQHILIESEDGEKARWRPERIGPVARIAEHSETLYVMRPNELVLLDHETVDPRVIEWGLPPSYRFRDMLSLGNRLLIATDRGVAVIRGMALTVLDGESGLPYEDVVCLTEGFDRDLWIGTTWGAARQVRSNEFHYFAGERWLPDNKVNDIAVGDHAVYIATDGGLGIIRYEPYTLQKKAAYYERRLEEWGHKRMGFTHLIHKDSENEWIREITDNDGGFTAHYLVAMIYKYAATGDEQAWEEAVNTLNAMVWLEEITPIYGFPARSIWSIQGDAGQQSTSGSGGRPARWVRSECGDFEWKGDTSSDEVGAHFYAMAVFYELAPDGPEKDRAREHVERLTRHIVENGWKLRDMGGELTRWGRWDPEYLQRPYGMYARGLNGMEAQAYVHTALGMVGDDYYRDALQQLLDWRYHDHTVRQKITFPPDYITTWDDRLAFMSYYPLVKYAEKDWLRALYLRSLERSWEIKRIEKHPWYNFLYGIISGNECEAEEGVQFLREWPLDLISYTYRNSHRADLHSEPGYTPYAVGPRTDSPKRISPRESEPKKLDATELRLDGGSGGRRSITPNTWLETYWKGRYYGLITPPMSDDPALIDIEDRRPPRNLGAAPYDGPPRPF